MNKLAAFWERFLSANNLPSETKYYEAFHFCNDEKNANELLALVLEGKKTATASALPSYEIEGEPQPKIGDLSIVTDFSGNPFCVIETVSVLKMPFRDMTYDICKREGEDENLEGWQNNHIKFFSEEAQSLGFEFSWDMEIVFEDFKVIYKEGHA